MTTIHLAARNILQDRTRFALSVVAVSLALMLILFLFGLRAGTRRSAVIYLDNAPGSVAVLPLGATTTGAGSAQSLPAETAGLVANTPGVARVTPVIITMGFSEFHGTKEGIKLVGYSPDAGGGPWSLKEGREPATNDEVVLDGVVAGRHGLKIGDSIAAGGETLRIVGLSNQTASWTGSYAFARKQALESMTLAPGASNLLLVTPAEGTTSTELVSRLRALPGTSVLLKEELMANDLDLIAGIFDRIILLMVVAAFVVGALVVGMVIYTATNERRSEYGILKAIGARNAVLYRVVVAQSLLAGSFGALLGVVFAFAMGEVVMAARPQFLVIIHLSSISLTIGAGLVMAAAGGLLPARSAGSLAPAEVFRG